MVLVKYYKITTHIAKKNNHLLLQLVLNIVEIDTAAFLKQVCAIYPDVAFSCVANATTFKADRTFIHQVMINLIKNAIEASTPPIKVTLGVHKQGKVSCITIDDNGQGLANPDNLRGPQK